MNLILLLFTYHACMHHHDEESISDHKKTKKMNEWMKGWMILMWIDGWMDGQEEKERRELDDVLMMMMITI